MNYDFNICHNEDGIDHGVDLFGIEDGAQENLEAYLIETLYQLNPRYTSADMAEVLDDPYYSDSYENFIDELLSSRSKVYTDRLLSQLYYRLSPEMQYEFIDTINEIYMFSNLHIVHQNDALVLVNIR